MRNKRLYERASKQMRNKELN